MHETHWQSSEANEHWEYVKIITVQTQLLRQPDMIYKSIYMEPFIKFNSVEMQEMDSKKFGKK